MAINLLGTHISQPKDDNTRQIGAAGGKEIAEVEVVSQENALLGAGLFQDLHIVGSVETLC